jgi:RHH-type transcriptional regulator, proline utilization regulon repressor / proline dehydrogenase / delta 1-pyrroline-5-carboxylate dehydrogenase
MIPARETIGHDASTRSFLSLNDSRLREADLEVRTQAFGREIFERARADATVPFNSTWWDERLMEWTMGDEAVKVQLFRFIDVLPLLTSAPEIARHLREYFSEAQEHLPSWARLGLRWMPSNGWAGGLVARGARWNAERLARRFIAGTDAAEAVAAVARLRRRRLAFTVDLLGEATVTEAEADLYQAEYFELIKGLTRDVNSWEAIPQVDADDRGPLPRVNLSIKLSSLYSQFDPIDPAGTSAQVRNRLRPILREARRRGAFVNVDMEQYAFKDLTLDIFKQILEEEEFRDWADVGIAIQVYLRDTERDLEGLLRWAEARGTGVWVRLIKGAYWDYETVMAEQQDWPTPVFCHKGETDANFERLTRFLMIHRDVLYPALGTHNVRSLASALATAEMLGLPPRSFEFQMLYGMAGPLQSSLTSLGHRVRIYTPVGQLLPGMAYLVRRLLENTANESFLRASFTEHMPEERLLMNPLRDIRSGEMPANGNGEAKDSSARSPRKPAFVNEPLTDFSREDARREMSRALNLVGEQLARTYPAVVGGQALPVQATIDRANPSHVRQLVGRSARSTSSQAEQAIAGAAGAFAAWRDVPPVKRARYLFRAAEAVRRRRFELAAWQVYECGKQWREADADVAETIDYLNYYASEMVRLAPPQRRDVPGEENEYFYEPRGVTVVIAPWNFPLAILSGMSAAAIVTGNTVVFKPAEQSSIVGAKLMEVFQEVCLPPGVANYLPGVGEEVGPVLVDNPQVAMIAFTGSRGVGLHINRQAATVVPGQDHVKRALAEMGGKNAIIVDDDADLDEAVRGVAASAFGYQGQKCSACSRAIVLESIHDVFLNRLVEATRSLKIAPAEDPGSTVGPLIDDESRQRVLGYVEKGKKESRLVYAGELGSLAEDGYYVAPHIFADVSPSAVIAQEEIFGPVLAVIRARDLNHALEIANGTQYALTGGIFSRSPAHIAQVRREFRVGNLYINRKITGALVDRQPFGGFKMSGIGSKAGGPDYLLQFVQPRTITENTLRRGFAPATDAPK